MSVYSVVEEETVVTVCSSITDGSLERAVTIDFVTANGAARGISQCVCICIAFMFIISARCSTYGSERLICAFMPLQLHLTMHQPVGAKSLMNSRLASVLELPLWKIVPWRILRTSQ